MAIHSRAFLLAAGLMAVPMALAMAQQNNPTGNQGSNRSMSATPGTADSKPASGVNTGDVGHSTGTSNYGGSAMSNTSPGATGHTVVPGTTSSQASSSRGTVEQKSGTTGSSGNK